MKQTFTMVMVSLLIGFVSSGCEKEDISNQNTTNSVLKKLGVSNISVQDGMLCFDSWDQYLSTVNALAKDCEDHDSDCFFYQDKRRFIHGKLSTTTLSISGATTLYNRKDNGKKSLWYSKIRVFVEGSKGSSCEDFDASSHFINNYSSLPWGCYCSVISLRGTFPTYIISGNHIHGIYEAIAAEQRLDLYL